MVVDIGMILSLSLVTLPLFALLSHTAVLKEAVVRGGREHDDDDDHH
jgi:hypothetical protein